MLVALFCGISVTSTKNGGVDEFFNKENGVLCDIGNHEQIAMSISKVMPGDIVFDSMKISESVMKKFNTEEFKINMKKEIDEVYTTQLK